MKITLSIIMVLAAMLVHIGAYSKEARLMGTEAENIIQNQYIVVFHSNIEESAKSVSNDIVEQHGGKILDVYEHALKGVSIQLSPKALTNVRKDSRVEYVEVDRVFKNMKASVEWGLDRIDQRPTVVDGIYDVNGTGAGVSIYIVDSGIRSTHNEFIGRLGTGIDYINDGNDDCNGHGTWVAGLAGGTTYGVAPSATLHDVRVVDCNYQGLMSHIVSALNWIKLNKSGPTVVNLSFHVPNFTTTMENALKNLINDNVVVVTAAANFNSNVINYWPANEPLAITAGATDIFDDRWVNPNRINEGSNYGPGVDLFAPGVNIKSAHHLSDNATISQTGTSASAPLVAGTAALYLELNPSASNTDVANAIINNATIDAVSNPNGSPNRLLYAVFTNDPPSTPSNFNIANLCYGLNRLSWSTSTGDVDRYEVYTDSSPTFTYQALAYSGNDTFLTVNVPATRYYRVRACNYSNQCSDFTIHREAVKSNFCF